MNDVTPHFSVEEIRPSVDTYSSNVIDAGIQTVWRETEKGSREGHRLSNDTKRRTVLRQNSQLLPRERIVAIDHDSSTFIVPISLPRTAR